MNVKLSKAIKKKIHHPFSDRYDNLCLFKSTMINSFTVMVFVRSEQQNILNVYIPITRWQLGGNPLCISHASSLTLTDMLPLRNNNVTCHSQAGQKHSGNLIWWTCQNIIQKENEMPHSCRDWNPYSTVHKSWTEEKWMTSPHGEIWSDMDSFWSGWIKSYVLSKDQ